MSLFHQKIEFVTYISKRKTEMVEEFFEFAPSRSTYKQERETLGLKCISVSVLSLHYTFSILADVR